MRMEKPKTIRLQDTQLSATHPDHVTECLLACLTQRERDIITSRWALEKLPKKTLEEIGKHYGITRERVRQIERASLQKIKRLVDYKKELEQMRARIDNLLTKFGGILAEYHLLDEYHQSVQQGQRDGVVEHTKRRLLFLCKQFMHEFFHFFEASGIHKEGWARDPSCQEQAKKVIKAIEVFLDKLGKPASHQEIAEYIRAPVDSAYAHLKLSKNIEQNPFGLWGLAHWREVRPKRMSDRIYAVLKKYDQPLHYRDITRYIEQHYNRPIHPPTVHNDLIADDRFVLVGRGMYALKEWGYMRGTVKEVVESILEQASQPLSQEDVVNVVAKQRLVARSTILLALHNSERIGRVGGDEYVFKNPKSKVQMSKA